MKMNDKIEMVKSFCLGHENLVNVLIYGKNVDSEKASFSFNIKFTNGDIFAWDNCSENYGGFEYDSEEDAVDAALDFLIDHATFNKINQKDLRKAQYDADLNELNENVEEIPEDFRVEKIR